MNQWQCSNCNYILEAELPPDECPSCKEKCIFLNITCYTPDCGGPGNVDPQLIKR
jgi:rubredoxin